ncbi:MAG: PAS domain S-box protein [Chloroflexota bacterium]
MKQQKNSGSTLLETNLSESSGSATDLLESNVSVSNSTASTMAEAKFSLSDFMRNRTIVLEDMTKTDLIYTVMESLPDGICVKDLDCRILITNEAFATLVGADTKDELIGQTDMDLFAKHTAEEHIEEEQAVLSGKTDIIRREEFVFNRRGKGQWLSHTKVPLRNQNQDIIGLINICRDVTSQKKDEEDIRQIGTRNLILAKALEASSDGVIITDPRQFDNPIIYVNRAFTRITGYQPEEVLGLNARFLQGPGTDPEILAEIRRVIASGEELQVVILNHRKNGEPFWNELKFAPIFSEEGELLYYVDIQTDITERKEAQDTLKAVLDTVGEGIVTMDQGGHIIMVNQEVLRIWGYEHYELLDEPLNKLLSDQHKEENLFRRLGKRFECTGRDKQGRRFPLEIYISETNLGEQLLYTAAVRDITERKELERMRDEFVSTVSHELRTPLASIMGWTETILSERPGPLTAHQRRFMNIVFDSSQRLNKLIEEILTVSRIQRGILRLDKGFFTPTETLSSIHEMLSSVATEKGISLALEDEWQADDTMKGDPDRLNQVLTNLIGNAIKFSPDDEVVMIRSIKKTAHNPVTHQSSLWWRFEVQDHGIGIPASEIRQLFDRFFRASNANKAQIQGTGLGLYVCKAVIDGHHGQIGLDSVEGEGTTAWFEIPCLDGEEG